jgi:ABC-type uncharacterized transport system involved in gliding motility auxiliary subunit
MQEVRMSKTRFALAASALMLTCGAALAQDAPSYESRGYGGPLYIGPNFHQGGQMSPPTYDSGSRSYERTERYRAPQRLDRVQSRKQNDDDDVKAAKKTEPAKEQTAKSESENSSISVTADADKKPTDTAKTDTAKANTEKSANEKKSANENSTIASVATTAKADPVKASVTKADTDAASAKPSGCKRYFPTIGQTLSVPCD